MVAAIRSRLRAVSFWASSVASRHLKMATQGGDIFQKQEEALLKNGVTIPKLRAIAEADLAQMEVRCPVLGTWAKTKWSPS